MSNEAQYFCLGSNMLPSRSLPLRIFSLIKQSSDTSRLSSEKGKSPKFFSEFRSLEKNAEICAFFAKFCFNLFREKVRKFRKKTNEKISGGKCENYDYRCIFFREIRSKFSFTGNPRERTILYQLLSERTLSFILLTTRQLGRDNLLNKKK